MSIVVDITEEMMVDLVRKQDREGYDALYERYAGLMYGAIRRRLKDDLVANEILTATFVKVWKDIDQYDEKKEGLCMWMLNIAMNTCTDYERNDFQGHSLHQIEINNNRQPITALIQTTSLELLELVFIKKCTYEDVARELNIPLEEVKIRTRKALRLLRNNL